MYGGIPIPAPNELPRDVRWRVFDDGFDIFVMDSEVAS